jgi:DNA-binding transcriptional ArsR family regulator
VAKHSAIPHAGGDRAPRRGDDERESKSRGLRSVGGRVPADGAMALDRLIHERMRLGILSALAVNDSLTFNDLKKLLRTTDGNVSVHARKLEEANYVSCTKSFVGRVPKTQYAIRPAGRRALERYLDHMEALIRAARDR